MANKNPFANVGKKNVNAPTTVGIKTKPSEQTAPTQPVTLTVATPKTEERSAVATTPQRTVVADPVLVPTQPTKQTEAKLAPHERDPRVILIVAHSYQQFLDVMSAISAVSDGRDRFVFHWQNFVLTYIPNESSVYNFPKSNSLAFVGTAYRRDDYNSIVDVAKKQGFTIKPLEMWLPLPAYLKDAKL